MPRPGNQQAIAAYIAGLRQAKAAFQALPLVVREAMFDATEVTCSEIARTAQARILASPSVRTRALYDHIAWSVSRTNGRGRVGVATGATTLVIDGKKVRVKGLITAGAGGSALKSAGAKKIVPSRYAHFVEFGTVHMPAEPFMLPAAEAERMPFLARCERAGAGIERRMTSPGGSGTL